MFDKIMPPSIIAGMTGDSEIESADAAKGEMDGKVGKGNVAADHWSRARALVFLGLAGVFSAIWAAYSPELLKGPWIQKTLGTREGVAITFSVCIIFGVGVHVLIQEIRWNRLWVMVGWIPLAFIVVLALSAGFNWHEMKSGMWSMLALLVIGIPFLLKTPDYPQNPQEDLLGRRLLYENYDTRIRQLLALDPQRGIIIGVRGTWGSGKSHFINHLCSKLANKYTNEKPSYAHTEDNSDAIFSGRCEIICLDIWKCCTPEDMYSSISEVLSSAMTEQNLYLKGRWGKLLSRLARFFHPSASSAFDEIQQLLATGIYCNHAPSATLRRKMLRCGKAYVLVIDNVERCDEKVREAMFPVLEKLKSLPKLVTVCGIAAGDENKEGSDDVSSHRSAVMKVFNLVISIPKPETGYIQDYMRRQIERKGISDCKYVMEWIRREPDLGLCTPREVDSVVDELLTIEMLYLKRIFGRKASRKDQGQVQGYISSVFYMAVMGILYPRIATTLETSDDPLNDLAYLHSLYGEVPVGSSNNAARTNKWKQCAEIVKTSFRLQSILNRFASLKSEQQLYAIYKGYLHLGNLNEKECEYVMIQNEKDKCCPLITIKNHFKEEISDMEATLVYMSVFDYALNKLSCDMARNYIKACIEQDLTQGNLAGLKALNAEALYSLVDAWCGFSLRLHRKMADDDTDEFMRACITKLISSFSPDKLQEAFVDICTLSSALSGKNEEQNAHVLAQFSNIKLLLTYHIPSLERKRRAKYILDIVRRKLLTRYVEYVYGLLGEMRALRELRILNCWDNLDQSVIRDVVMEKVAGMKTDEDAQRLWMKLRKAYTILYKETKTILEANAESAVQGLPKLHFVACIAEPLIEKLVELKGGAQPIDLASRSALMVSRNLLDIINKYGNYLADEDKVALARLAQLSERYITARYN